MICWQEILVFDSTKTDRTQEKNQSICSGYIDYYHMLAIGFRCRLWVIEYNCMLSLQNGYIFLASFLILRELLYLSYSPHQFFLKTQEKQYNKASARDIRHIHFLYRRLSAWLSYNKETWWSVWIITKAGRFMEKLYSSDGNICFQIAEKSIISLMKSLQSARRLVKEEKQSGVIFSPRRNYCKRSNNSNSLLGWRVCSNGCFDRKFHWIRCHFSDRMILCEAVENHS